MALTALKATILGTAVGIARQAGLQNITRVEVAHLAECSTGIISHHFGDMDGLINAVVEYAVQHEVLEIITQARAIKHVALEKMSAALKERVADFIVR